MKAVSKKSLLFTILIIALIAVIAVGGTVAYLSGEDEVTNTFSIGRITVDLDEPNWDEDSGLELTPGKVMEKDPTVTAITGTSYMRVRMDIVDAEGELITDVARINLILETLYHDLEGLGTNIDVTKMYYESDLQSMVTANKLNKGYNKADFAFAGIQTGNPAVRYYNYIANDGIFDSSKVDSKTVVLFTNVIIPKDWHNEEIYILSGDEYEAKPNGAVEVITKGTGYKILLKAEAIQSSETENPAKAFGILNTATGVTLDASGI